MLKLLHEYAADLSMVRGLIDHGIQVCAANWEDQIPHLRDLNGGVRAGDIRSSVAAGWQRIPQPATRLSLEVRSYVGLHFYTQDATRLRVKTRPRNPKNGHPLEITELDFDEDLFGTKTFAGPFEFAILYTIDFGTASLDTATLAAVDFGRDDNGPVIIYAEEEIPAIPASGSGSTGAPTPPSPPSPGPTSTGHVEDDFDEYLDEKDFGPDPA
ncbi:hypothetical protein AB0C27_10065 [Nonomuraea sp. NPDC048882]|uniref:hypothetical protein n=1 Tax=Nonomuraea sp. NPDC048882 TaxID=3154347 RepID=UPI0033E3ACCB